MMAYATEHIASTLKNTRKAKGFTQRALGRKAAVPQSHISKIENGAVDLRVSSLVELARALNLELMLVPRKTVSAVQSIIRSDVERAFFAKESTRQTLREFTRLQDYVADLAKLHPSRIEVTQLARQVRELQYFQIPHQHLDAIRSIRKAVKAFNDGSQSWDTVRDWLSQLSSLRSSLAHELDSSEESESSRPAYSLDEDDHG